MHDILIENCFQISARRLQLLHAELVPHPVEQSRSHSDGLIITARSPADVPDFLGELRAILVSRADFRCNEYTLAINRSRPSNINDFLLRPHLDRQFKDGHFHDVLPTWTSVYFLDFPANSQGGELVVFDPFFSDELSTLERMGGRHSISGFPHRKLDPRPGVRCEFPGHYPHGVLGHAVLGHENSRLHATRTALVFAEFNKG